MIQRVKYLEKLQMWRDKPVIKVVTGVRRSGKSTLLQQFAEQIKSVKSAKVHCLSINFEDVQNAKLLDYRNLHDYVVKHLKSGMNYLFFDEIQMVPSFQKAVDSLFLRKDVDIYITGSNAYILGGELATLLSGRYVQIKVQPLSFEEFLSAYGGDKDDVFRKYFVQGGFPGLLALPETLHRDYMEGLFSTVLLKDVAQRLKISDYDLLQVVTRYLADSIGNIVTAKKISDYLVSNGRKTTHITISSYLKGLEDAFLIYHVNRYDVKGKMQLQSLGKYYLSDLGLRTYLLGPKNADMGFVLENIVYLELIRRGYDVQIGRAGDKEIDFVATKGEEINYYQVSASVLDSSTLQREIAPLQNVKDNYPKYLLTLDKMPIGVDGINQKNIVEFLLE